MIALRPEDCGSWIYLRARETDLLNPPPSGSIAAPKRTTFRCETLGVEFSACRREKDADYDPADRYEREDGDQPIADGPSVLAWKSRRRSRTQTARVANPRPRLGLIAG